MRKHKNIGWVALGIFAAALVMMLALFVAPILGWDKCIEKCIPINVDVVLLVIALVALTASVLGFIAFKTIQGKVASIGGLLLAVVAGALFATTAVSARGSAHRSDTQEWNQPKKQPRRPVNASKQLKKEPLPDDPVSKEARAAAGKILDRLLTGKLEEDESGLATRAKALKGFKSWSIESQQKAEQGSSRLEGLLTGPSGQARFSMTIVKQENGKWMVGGFSGPNPIE